MKPQWKILAVLLVCLAPVFAKGYAEPRGGYLTPEESRMIEQVIDALEVVESGGWRVSSVECRVVGDGGRAMGSLQMWPVAVREANRIAGETRWNNDARFSPVKSREMARTILSFHYGRGCTDPVELGCRWRNPYSKAPEWYRERVRVALCRSMWSAWWKSFVCAAMRPSGWTSVHFTVRLSAS